MTATIKLDFISDVVCPWCIIGYKRLQQAINELGIQGQITELGAGMGFKFDFLTVYE